MHKLLTLLQALLGITYFTFGIGGFLDFLPTLDFPGVRGEYLYASLQESNYILPMLYSFSLIAGTSLLLNLFAALFLLLFLPITINFSLFYYFLGNQVIFDPEMFLPLMVNFIHIVLTITYFPKYRDLFKYR